MKAWILLLTLCLLPLLQTSARADGIANGLKYRAELVARQAVVQLDIQDLFAERERLLEMARVADRGPEIHELLAHELRYLDFKISKARKELEAIGRNFDWLAGEMIDLRKFPDSEIGRRLGDLRLAPEQRADKKLPDLKNPSWITPDTAKEKAASALGR